MLQGKQPFIRYIHVEKATGCGLVHAIVYLGRKFVSCDPNRLKHRRIHGMINMSRENGKGFKKAIETLEFQCTKVYNGMEVLGVLKEVPK